MRDVNKQASAVRLDKVTPLMGIASVVENVLERGVLGLYDVLGYVIG